MLILHLKTRKESSFFKKLFLMNWFFICIVGLICCLGFLTLYSAAQGHLSPWADKQILRFGVGLLVFFGIALTDIKIWMRYAYPFYGLSLAGLIAAEFIGHIGGGAQSWLNLYFFQLQPSEVMKISLILALARYFHLHTEKEIRQLRYLLVPFALILAPFFLVLIQPDLGTATMLLLTGALLLFLGGIPLWLVVSALSATFTALPLLWMFMHEYQKQRVLTFLDPLRDPLGSGYHIIQSKIALGSGGFWGKGFLKGSQGYLDYLPEKETDFIFTLFCEEFGMVGGLILLGFYGLLIVIGYRTSLNSRHHFGRLVSLGITNILFLYVFINVAMVMGIVPVVGVPLPLMSYGGTAMLSILMGFGFLMSVEVHPTIQIERPSKFD